MKLPKYPSINTANPSAISARTATLGSSSRHPRLGIHEGWAWRLTGYGRLCGLNLGGSQGQPPPQTHGQGVRCSVWQCTLCNGWATTDSPPQVCLISILQAYIPLSRLELKRITIGNPRSANIDHHRFPGLSSRLGSTPPQGASQ